MGRYLIIDTKAYLSLNKDNSYDQQGTYRGRFLSEEETEAKFKEVFMAGRVNSFKSWDTYNKSGGKIDIDFWEEFKKQL